MRKGIYDHDLKTPEDIAEYNKAELSRVFADTLSNNSKAGIIVQSVGNHFRKSVVVGVPYRLETNQVEKFPCSDVGHAKYESVGILVVGPYAVNSARLHVPQDHDNKEIKIPLKDIIDFKRIELSDLIKE